MRYPPRLAHLATRAVVVAKLWPTFAAAHEMDEEEAEARLTSALQGQLLDELLAHAWEAMRQKAPRADESALLEKVAQTLSDRPRRAGRTAKLNSAWSCRREPRARRLAERWKPSKAGKPLSRVWPRQAVTWLPSSPGESSVRIPTIGGSGVICI